MKQYRDLLRELLTAQGRVDRTGTGTRSVFGRQLRFPLDPLPVVTSKKVHLPSVIAELCWFLRGETSLKFLHEYGCTIWDEWADENGELGPVYGAQWRAFSVDGSEGVDQIAACLESLRDDPMSRRHIISAWNPAALPHQSLPPCHMMVQFYVDSPVKTTDPLDAKPQNRLNLQVYQRSCDVFLGLPFNITSYALLGRMFCHILGYNPGELVMSLGDAHLYENHIEQASALLSRQPLPQTSNVEFLEPLGDLKGVTPKSLKVVGYQSHGVIKAPVSV